VDTAPLVADIPDKYQLVFAELSRVPPVKIGEGAFGVVYKCKYRQSFVAVKQLKQISLDSDQGREFLAEARLMIDLKPHANVVTFLGICLDPLAIVTEFLPEGALNDKLEDDSFTMPWSLQVSIIKDVAAGMLHLQEEKIVHKDLAARNVLLGRHYNAKVADFGMSRTLGAGNTEHHSVTEIGPLKWMAPESLANRVYSSKSDVWAWAVTVVEILTRREPYPDLTVVQFASRFFVDNLNLLDALPSSTPPALREILQSAFAQDPAARPDFEAICESLTVFDDDDM
jgi:mitogen-activated protein kinase kinase kinase 9